jgi:hypothetical protein
MERFDTLGTISRLVVTAILKSHFTISVNRSARTERGLSFHPQHRPSQRPPWHFVNFPSNDLPLVTSQYWKYSYRFGPGASHPDNTTHRAGRDSECMAVHITRMSM